MVHIRIENGIFSEGFILTDEHHKEHPQERECKCQRQIVPLLSLGGKGVISVLSNVLPKKTVEMCDKFFAGDVKGSAEIQLQLIPLINALFCEVNPIPVKVAMRMMGFDVGPLRMPLCEMEDVKTQKLESILKKYNLI